MGQCLPRTREFLAVHGAYAGLYSRHTVYVHTLAVFALPTAKGRDEGNSDANLVPGIRFVYGARCCCCLYLLHTYRYLIDYNVIVKGEKRYQVLKICPVHSWYPNHMSSYFAFGLVLGFPSCVCRAYLCNSYCVLCSGFRSTSSRLFCLTCFYCVYGTYQLVFLLRSELGNLLLGRSYVRTYAVA